MKWSPENVEKLKELCFAEMPNADIAAHFGKPLKDIHAARSALGITIPKVKEMKRNESNQAPAQQPLESFINGDMHCIVLARRGETALICITNNTLTPFVVPLEHRKGATDWWHGSYFTTLDDAWEHYSNTAK